MSAVTTTRERTPHGTVTVQSMDPYGESVWAHITARSQRHADRLATLLGWSSHYHGVGRSFGDVWFDARRKRLVAHFGLDV